MSTPESFPFSDEAFLDAYATTNTVEDSHKRALGHQAILRELYPYTDFDEMNSLMGQAIKELDEQSGHMNTPVIVSGKVRVRSVDPKGIDIKERTLDPSAIEDVDAIVEDSTVLSLGYTIERRNDTIEISHLASSGQEQILESTLAGDAYRTSRIFIPIDGSAYAELAQPETVSPRIKLLETFTEDLIDDIDIAILNGESLSESLQSLGQVDLSDALKNIEDTSIFTSLVDYINSIMPVSRNIPYKVSGVESISIQLSDESYGRADTNKTMAITGNLQGIIIDEDSQRFELAGIMPFSDDTLRVVTFPLSETIQVKQHDSLQVIA